MHVIPVSRQNDIMTSGKFCAVCSMNKALGGLTSTVVSVILYLVVG